MITRLTFDQISTAVHDAYEACKDIKGGQNAHYIPYLANVNSDLFGISLCLPDGRLISVGDTDYRFGIESVSKVHTAILALEQHGAQAILDDIGADATGLPFNSIFAILLENDRPSTPLVNAGAIAACSLVKPHGDTDGKWKAIFDNMTALLGSEPQLIDELYQSESATNFDNRSITWLLQEYGRMYDDPEMSLDLYTRQCSLGVTAEQLAISAATIADDGVNPLTKQRVRRGAHFQGGRAHERRRLLRALGRLAVCHGTAREDRRGRRRHRRHARTVRRVRLRAAAR